MIDATRRWFRRNRTNLAVGAGVIGAGYLAGQYVLGKISEARQRMTEDRIAKEKYGETALLSRMTTDLRSVVSAAALSKTRRIARTLS